MHEHGFILWLTGLSGAGKSTLANALVPHLEAGGHRVELLDGDGVRTHLSHGLGFSREDRDVNVRRIGWVADLVARHGGVAVVAAISPYLSTREELKRSYPHLVEVYVQADVQTCAGRDVKGLYARALRGEIKDFTGVSDPYEPPTHPHVIVDTRRESLAESTQSVLNALTKQGRFHESCPAKPRSGDRM